MPTRTFRFWTGDDTDASVVADEEGYLYVGQEWDRRNDRGRQIGQLLKIDPRRPDNPVVWSIPQQSGEKSGTWSTPALYGDLVIWPTYIGPVFGIDRASGAIRWTIELPYAVMSSPVVVDDTLVQADAQGVLHAYDLTGERHADRALDGAAAGQRRVDPGPVEGPHLRGYPGRLHVRHGRRLIGPPRGCGPPGARYRPAGSSTGHGGARVSDIEETGAIDWLLVEAQGKEINGELVPPLLDLVDRRLIRILDVVVLVKRGEGDFDALTTDDLDPAQVGDLGALAGSVVRAADPDDAAAAAAAMSPNTLGLLIVYENLWSLPSRIAVRKAGGQLVAQGHIPTQAIVAALDALEA